MYEIFYSVVTYDFGSDRIYNNHLTLFNQYLINLLAALALGAGWLVVKFEYRILYLAT